MPTLGGQGLGGASAFPEQGPGSCPRPELMLGAVWIRCWKEALVDGRLSSYGTSYFSWGWLRSGSSLGMGGSYIHRFSPDVPGGQGMMQGPLVGSWFSLIKYGSPSKSFGALPSPIQTQPGSTTQGKEMASLPTQSSHPQECS